MIFALIGHRGVGKSALLKRIQSRQQHARIVDLDEMIAAFKKMPIDKIFEVHGEQYFRQLESKLLSDLVSVASRQLGDVWVAVGAGFEGPMPQGLHVVWVRRTSDATGRIFIDRPRLEPELRPLDEYFVRFADRQTRFAKWADDCFEMREGSHRVYDDVEAQFFSEQMDLSGAARTLLPKDFLRPELESKLKTLLDQRISYLELRDDLLSFDQMRWVLNRCPSDRILMSFRKGQLEWLEHAKGCATDIDLNLLDVEGFQSVHPKIVSWHPAQNFRDLSSSDLAHLESVAVRSGAEICKLVASCQSFEDLKALNSWSFASDLAARVVRCGLPCSESGRWAWYRLFLKGRTPLSFVREFDTGVSDQPTLVQWAASVQKPQRFAAVLGQPVAHSQSPLEHEHFFKKNLHAPFWAIDMSSEEFGEGALKFLSQLGLIAAAVTSPLKRLVFDRCQGEKKMQIHESVNTLSWVGADLRFCNTDLVGLRAIIEQDFSWTLASRGEGVVVWGQGAMAQQLEFFWPLASVYSSGEKSQQSELVRGPRPVNPSLLVWAAGPKAPLPNQDWGASLIWDLNYVEHSLAREYAQRTGAHYLSGETLFCRQAAAQRSFWSKTLL